MENTPYYYYDLEVLDNTLDAALSSSASANFHIHYAVKANNNKKIMEFIAKRGFGADCVSGWEIEAAIAAGFDPSLVVFAGVGKTDQEIAIALNNRIGMIHCESLEEILVINEMAEQLDFIPNVALRLNPNVNPLTHAKISTGLTQNKFGLTVMEFAELVERLPELNNINIVGLHFHIGSQITQMHVFAELCARINEIVPQYENTIGKLTYLNVGGGLGINYEDPDAGIIPDFENYFNVFKEGLSGLNVPVHFELGRSIVGQCGSLRTKVLYVKKSAEKNFAVLDAGMTELLRPALYGAKHKIEKMLVTNDAEQEQAYDIVGPICESSDSFGEGIRLPELKRGDILTIRSCGAYAESMSLRYNGRQEVGSNLKRVVNTSLRMVRTA